MSLLSKYLSKIRANKVLPYVHGSVLDLGCGDALPLRFIPERIDVYYGVEYDEKCVEKLTQTFPNHKFFTKDLDEDVLCFEKKFDTVLIVAVIEHLLNQKHFLKQVLKNSKPGGKIVITTPTPFGDWVHRIGSKLAIFAESADHRHIIILSKTKLKLLANYFGLKIEKYQRFEFGCNQLIVLSKSNPDHPQ